MPLSKSEYADSLAIVRSAVNVEARLPQWPFVRSAGHVGLCEFSLMIGGNFEPVLAALATAHGDREVIFAVAEPDYYERIYGLYPAFRITASALVRTEGWWQALNYEPGGNRADAFVDSARIVAAVGDSGRWAAWGERYKEIAVLHTDIREGAWLASGVPFRSAQFVYDHWIHPSWSNRPLDQNERSVFVELFKDAVTSPED